MGFQVKTQRCCLLSICNVIIVRDFRDSTVLKLNLCIVGINYMEHMCFFAILLVLLAFPISMDRMHMNLARLFSLESFFKLFSVNVLLHSNPAVASSQIDEWLEYAPVFSLGPAFENACKYVDDFLQSRTFLVGYCFSIADVAIWSTLAGTTFGDCLFISFLFRHF